MIWSIENLRARESVSHQKKERAGTATVRFSCSPLGAQGDLWVHPQEVVPFSVMGDELRFGENFEAVQREAIQSHNKECPGHQGQHHFMLTAGFTYRS